MVRKSLGVLSKMVLKLIVMMITMSPLFRMLMIIRIMSPLFLILLSQLQLRKIKGSSPTLPLMWGSHINPIRGIRKNKGKVKNGWQGGESERWERNLVQPFRVDLNVEEAIMDMEEDFQFMIFHYDNVDLGEAEVFFHIDIPMNDIVVRMIPLWMIQLMLQCSSRILLMVKPIWPIGGF